MRNNEEKVKAFIVNHFKSFDDNSDTSLYNRYDENFVFVGSDGNEINGLGSLKPVFESIRQDDSYSTKHNLLNIIVREDDPNVDYVVATDIRVDYALKNGKKLSIPVANFIKIKNFKLIEQKAFVDFLPLFKALSE